MIDATYLRRQAELYFAIADLMSDPADALQAREAAAECLRRAQSAEQKPGPHFAQSPRQSQK
jgi:hypothetical protein